MTLPNLVPPCKSDDLPVWRDSELLPDSLFLPRRSRRKGRSIDSIMQYFDSFVPDSNPFDQVVPDRMRGGHDALHHHGGKPSEQQALRPIVKHNDVINNRNPCAEKRRKEEQEREEVGAMNHIDASLADKSGKGETGAQVFDKEGWKPKPRDHGRCIIDHQGLGPHRVESAGKASGPGKQEQRFDLSVKKLSKMEERKLPTAQIRIEIQKKNIQWLSSKFQKTNSKR